MAVTTYPTYDMRLWGDPLFVKASEPKDLHEIQNVGGLICSQEGPSL